MKAAIDGVVGWPPDVADRYRRLGYWRGETLWSILHDRATTHPDRPAVDDGRTRHSYGGLHDRCGSLAAGLHALGIARGDRVVVQLPNTSGFVEALFALFRLGAIPVMALPAHRAVDIAYFVDHCDAVAFITTDVLDGFDHRQLAASLTPYLRHVIIDGDPLDGSQLRLADLDGHPRPATPLPEAGDVALLQLSGGSTGTPKLIPRTHDDYLYSVRASAEICRLDGSTVYLAVLPAAHNFTLSSPGILGTLLAGGLVVLSPRPRPDVAFAMIESHRVTTTAVTPSLAAAWIAAAPGTDSDLSSLTRLQVGGSKLAAALARPIRTTLGCRLQQVFGMAEGLVCYTRLDDPDEVVDHTQGRPISPHDEVLVVDDDDQAVAPGEPGHLLTRGPYTIRGYYRATEHNATAFTADGYYRTGDVVRVTDTGHIEVVGRAKDQINRAGEKIAAEEVEGHIIAHPAVLDTAVVGQPDVVLGERLTAYVVLRPGATMTGVDLKRFLRGRGVATFKVPDVVEVVERLPTTAVGKTSRRNLRRLATATPTDAPPVPSPPDPDRTDATVHPGGTS